MKKAFRVVTKYTCKKIKRLIIKSIYKKFLFDHEKCHNNKQLNIKNSMIKKNKYNKLLSNLID